MVNEEIVGGIKNALEHGDSLKDAMMSFFNAGYDKKEIEQAAATLLDYSTAVKAETKIPALEIKKVDLTQTPKVIQKVSSYGEEVPLKEQKEIPKPIPEVIISDNIKFVSKELPKTIINSLPTTISKKTEMPIQKKVSSSSAMTPQEKVIVAILIGLLIFLIGLLAVIFLFRQQLIDFISGLVN